MKTSNRVLSIVLSLLMLTALFAPLASVFAEDEVLTIVGASDNGGTTATSHAIEATPLGNGTSWYSANRDTADPKGTAIATYQIEKYSKVTGVNIAFYLSATRTFTFSIEVSEDGEQWTEALASTTSALQTNDKDVQSFVFAEAAEGIAFVRLIGTDGYNNYTAFYSFEVVGEAGTDYTPADEGLIAAMDAAYFTIIDENSGECLFTESDYTAESWLALTTAVARYDALWEEEDVNCSFHDEIKAITADLNNARSGLTPVGMLNVIRAVDYEGAPHTNAIYRATAAIPNLRAQAGVWWSADCSGDAVVSGLFTLQKEAMINKIVIDWYKGKEASRQYEFSISTSLDGVNFTEAVASTISTDLITTITFEEPIDALYIKFTSADGWVEGGNNWLAVNELTFKGDYVEGGAEPTVDATAYYDYLNIVKDLHEDLYTAESWSALETAIAAVDPTAPYSKQAEVDAKIAAIWTAIDSLVFANLDEIQIAQAYWDADTSGFTAWTNGAILFTQSGYSLADYKVNKMTLETWTRIYAMPTAEEGIYEITNIVNPTALTSGTAQKPTEDEIVGENEFGVGFALALHCNWDAPYKNGGASQYASQEFGDRNADAFAAMELTVGDKVQLNNVVFTEAQFADEGEDLQEAWLDTEGYWAHRYWTTVGLGEFTPSTLWRKSNAKNAAAEPDGPQYYAKDQFEDFISRSTLTKVVAPSYIPGDADGDNEVTVADLTVVAKYLAGWTVDFNELAADVDGEPEVTVGDLTVLAKWLAGWPVELLPATV